jgi:hypothetical protein
VTILGPATVVQLPRKGCEPSDQAKLDASPKAHEHPPVKAYLVGAKPLPLETHNAVHLVPAKDQGQSSACTAHSLSALVSTVCALAGVPCVAPSEHVLYTRSGRKEVPPGEPLQDDGRQPLDVWAAAQEDGFAPQGTSPDGRNSDVWTDADLNAASLTGPPANVNAGCSAARLDEAGKCRPPLTLVTIDPEAAAVELQVKASLAAGHLVWLGCEVGQAFEGLVAGQIAQPDPNPQDPEGGGHALFLVDYRTASDGWAEYLVRNSWGAGWDGTGSVWCSGAFVRACFELHAIGVSEAAPEPETLGERIVDALHAVEAL